MVMVTVFRGLHFNGGEEISDYDFPSVPRIGETISLFDDDRETFEKVTDVNYRAAKGGISVRVLVMPKVSGMRRVKLGGF